MKNSYRRATKVWNKNWIIYRSIFIISLFWGKNLVSIL